MANIKYISARRHQVGWYDELPDPYEDPYYNSHLSSDIGNNSYWNFLGKDGSKTYETWFRFSFNDEDMITPQQVGSISFQLAFRFHKDRASSKSNVPIRCYIFPKDLNDAYKLRDSIQMEKDEENLVTYAEQNVTFDSTFRDYTFDFVIDKPQSNEFLAVLKIHPDYEINGWCPVEWHHKLPLGGDIDSSQRTWKSTEIKLANYKITIIDGDTTSQEIEAIYDSELKGSYINIQAPQKNYYTFLGWSTTRDTKKPEFLYDETETDYQIGPFSKDTTLYEIYEKDCGILRLKGLSNTSCHKIQIKINYGENESSEGTYKSFDNDNYIEIPYKTGPNPIKITVTPTPNIGWKLSDGEESKVFTIESPIEKNEINEDKYETQEIEYTINYIVKGNVIVKKETKKYKEELPAVNDYEPSLQLTNTTTTGDSIEIQNTTNKILTIQSGMLYNFNAYDWNSHTLEDDPEIIDISANENSDLFFAIPIMISSEKIYAEINNNSNNNTTSLGQTITIDDNGGATASEITQWQSEEVDLTKVYNNIWNNVGKGQNFIFDFGENKITIFRKANEYTLYLDSQDPNFNLYLKLLSSYKYWTTHKGSPIAEFYLDFSGGNTPNIYLEKGIILYPVNTKRIYVGKNYFYPAEQIWK